MTGFGGFAMRTTFCHRDPLQGQMTMASKCANCESRKSMRHFTNEIFTIEHADMTAKVEDLSGWRCDACGEVEFDADSARRYAAAGDALVLRERQSKKIRASITGLDGPLT